MKQIVVINGPNLDLLGERQPEIYGSLTLGELNREIERRARELGLGVICHQSNSESEIIGWLHQYRTGIAGIVLNPAGLSHTSVAILDALLMIEAPIVEVHLSNIHKREEFRRQSITAAGAVGVISGFGKWSYLMAIEYLASVLQPSIDQSP
jgi:3-dehydroquinate dehydratase-2